MTNVRVFQRGDSVRLKSGGRIMVVDQVDKPAGMIVHCKWFDGNLRQQDTFYADALEYDNVALTTHR